MTPQSNNESEEMVDLEFELDLSELDDDPKLPTFKINSYPADFTLRGYRDKWDEKKLVIPDFQRAYVWDQKQASKLIESFLLGLPVPGVFLYARRNDKKLLVVDGQQRIFSAIKYFENDFEGKPFKLKGVSERYSGKSFAELDEADRNQLEDTVLRATVVQQLDPEDDTSIYHIFERLNTGAVSLYPMEVRKCVYYGPLMNCLQRLNHDNYWRLMLSQPKTDKRLRDVELVLRCLAMHNAIGSYEKPMKGFLNKFMIAVGKLDDDTAQSAINQFESWFRKTTQIAFDVLGEKPFHLRGKLNLAAMDSVFPLIADSFSTRNNELLTRYKLLRDNKQFIEDTAYNTSDTIVVKRRFDLAKKYLITSELDDLTEQYKDGNQTPSH
jgi:hypothetical protein